MIWLTADWHLGCDTLIKNTRPWAFSTKSHDDVIIQLTNDYVGRNDILVIIGDFCKEKPGRYRHRINCKNIFFVLGNHDNAHKTRAVFGGNVWEQKMVKFEHGQQCWCCHYPTAYWPQSHYGAYHAYGHIHHEWSREGFMNLAFPGRRSMDVGIDHAVKTLEMPRPFSEKEFLNCLTDRSGHDIIHKNDRWKHRDYSNPGETDA